MAGAARSAHLEPQDFRLDQLDRASVQLDAALARFAVRHGHRSALQQSNAPSTRVSQHCDSGELHSRMFSTRGGGGGRRADASCFPPAVPPALTQGPSSAAGSARAGGSLSRGLQLAGVAAGGRE